MKNYVRKCFSVNTFIYNTVINPMILIGNINIQILFVIREKVKLL